jgi:DNA-binding GntR family transcriptional regulator
VHRPTASQAGYLLALVMESQSVTLGDVLRSLVDLEPVCAGGCAGRSDRRTTVVPRLEATVQESLAVIDDARAYTVAARAFHHELVAGCGTQTTVLLVEALEAIWNAHVDRLVQADTHLGPFRSRAVRQDTVREHEHICELIRAGDVDATVQAMRAHYSKSAPDGRDRQFRIDLGTVVDAGLLRD